MTDSIIGRHFESLMVNGKARVFPDRQSTVQNANPVVTECLWKGNTLSFTQWESAPSYFEHEKCPGG